MRKTVRSGLAALQRLWPLLSVLSLLGLAKGCAPGPEPPAREAWYEDTSVALGARIPPQPDFVAPVRNPARIASTFGPRIKSTESRDDFHRGVDFPGEIDDPVYSIGDGVVFRLFREGSRAYPNGGNTLLVRYPLRRPFRWLNGVEVNQIFGVYLHLNRFDVQPGQAVEKGQVIAGIGQTGTTRFTHLHFEVRLQTHCSLEYQRRHPKAECARYGFDPHVHPFHFIGGAGDGEKLIEEEQAGDRFVVTLRSERSNLGITAIEADGRVLDFDTREGFDATTTRRLDDMDRGWVRIRPHLLRRVHTHIRYVLEFPARPGYVQFTDLHGNGVRRTYR